MPSYFERDPAFLPLVEKATGRALEDVADDIVRDARMDIAPFSSSAAKAVRKERVRSTPEGPSVPVKIGKGLGVIFEFSKEQNRLTKGKGKKQKYPAGVNRGVMQRQEFFHKNVEKHLGLGMGRYLNRYL